MKKLALLILLLTHLIEAYGQSSKNAVYLELGGSGLIYSINYERLWIENENLSLCTNIGATYIPSFFPNSDFKHIWGNSVGVSTLIGSQKHFAEIGFNLSYWYLKDIEDNTFLSTFLPLRLGYKYQKNDTGIFYKLAFVPIIPIHQDNDVDFLYPLTPHFSLGIGWAF